MNDYIERQAMLDAVDKLIIIPSIDGTGKPTPTEDFRVQFLGTVLKVTATDVVPVIRCRYCKHFMSPHACLHDDGMITAQSNGFCSYGERKE